MAARKRDRSVRCLIATEYRGRAEGPPEHVHCVGGMITVQSAENYLEPGSEPGRALRSRRGTCVNVMKSLMGCFVLCLGLAAGSEAQTVTLQAVADSSLKQSPANKNRGSDLTLELAGDGRVLVRFDQTAIAAAVGSGRLVSASLELFVHATSGSWGPDGRPIEAHLVTAAWTEVGVTWSCAVDSNPANNKLDCSSPWNGGSFADDATDSVVQTSTENVWMPFDVTADVAAFLGGTSNQGWLIVKADGDQSGKADYGSREGAAAERPRLVLLVESAAHDQVPPSLAITLAQPADPGQRFGAGDRCGVLGRRLGSRSLHPPSARGRPRRHGKLRLGAAVGELPRPHSGGGQSLRAGFVARPCRQRRAGERRLPASSGAGAARGDSPSAGGHLSPQWRRQQELRHRAHPPRPRERTAAGSDAVRRRQPHELSHRGDGGLSLARAARGEERPQLGKDGPRGRSAPADLGLDGDGCHLELSERFEHDERQSGLCRALGRRQLRRGAHGECSPHARPHRLGALRRHGRRGRFRPAALRISDGY